MTATKAARTPGASSTAAVCKDGYSFVLTHETKEIAERLDADQQRIAELEVIIARLMTGLDVKNFNGCEWYESILADAMDEARAALAKQSTKETI